MTRSRLDAFFFKWNPYQMSVGVLEDQRKISQFSLARKLHNTQHGYAYFEGEILYEKLQGFGIAMKTQVKILLTGIIGQGGIC
ncbi:hypothetical protein HanIR_Chr10g0475151 [Helianthus annuus]|nr:hypothetical protein HanIR_Chr10g0475151 [Helianthus annuus]